MGLREEGSLYQAFFKPKFSTATEEVHWTGYLQGLWVDAHGNLREDIGTTGVLELEGCNLELIQAWVDATREFGVY